ncbi:GGDEF domain-containing protein [Thioalkalivibrio denitrificans]|uniref:cyclic-guanylate-specific phosphodiesterase n=2 Tax=Thioalkalivibrio denitrificans TaxID=108003 RepID=A0A1V3NS03_9GAMM|nr:GGDEF domain-containing protein [Thioalkalivibrio denitrificans]
MSAPAAGAEPLIVSQDHAWPPFAFRDEQGSPRGLLVEFWELIGEELGRPVEFALTDWDDSLAQVRDGQAHVHGGLFRSPERERFLDFGNEIFPLRTAMFASGALTSSQVSDLADMPVGVTRGGFESEYLRTHHPGLNLHYYDNNERLIRAATRGEVEAFAADYPVAMYLLDRHASPEQFRVIEVLYARNLAFATARGETALLSELNNVIARLDPDELSRITQKWMHSEAVHRLPPGFWLGLLAGILTLLLGSLIIYSRLLRRQVVLHTHRLQETNDSLRAERDFSRSVLDASPAFFVALDNQYRIRMMNPTMLTRLGYTAQEVIGEDFVQLCTPEYEHESLQTLFHHMLVSGKPIHHESHALTRSGEERLVEWHGNSVAGPSGEPEFFFAIGLDITDRRRAETQLEHIAHFDPLTGLPNRSLLQVRLNHALDMARRRNRRVAVLFLDLDRFKVINDSLGHAYGDEVLRTITRRLRGRLREEDTIARWGGDEFIVMLEEVANAPDVSTIAGDILKELALPCTLSNGQDVYVGGSIGISLYPEDGDNAEQLIMRADTAMYQAKDQGRSTYQFYTSALTRAAHDRLALETSLRHALEREEFTLHYQPQVRVADGALIGLEALVRWRHPERGLVAPDEFIPLAEETGLIGPLGLWVMRTACRQAKIWSSLFARPLHMAVNVSVRQLRHPNLLDQVRSILQETGLPAQSLELELTESTLMSREERTEQTLRNLKELGVRLSIDDFGTGYSSLAYLKRMPIDVLKIDRSFVKDIPEDFSDMEIAATIIAMARTLRLQVVAEGVETPAQMDFLRERGCDSYQGFLLTRPMDAAAMTRWIDEYTDTRLRAVP